MVEIRRCDRSDAPWIRDFIEHHWRAGHVLARSQALLDWQYGCPGGYNIIGAWRDGDLVGMLGYIPTRRYDEALRDANILWLALWKVRDDLGIAGLGMRLFSALSKIEPNIGLAVNGINHALPPLYRAIRWQVEELTQYFAVDAGAPQTLIRNRSQRALPRLAGGDAQLRELDEDELRQLPADGFDAAVPRKTPLYFLNRYLLHPFYRYGVALLEAPARPPTLIAFRIAEHEGGRALRIVDILGSVDTLAASGNALLKLVRSHGAQYADLCQYGLSADRLAEAGFQAVGGEDEDLMVPNYFEPFVPQFTRTFCGIKAEGSPVLICRGDGDQDRPNQLAQDASV